MKAFLTWAARAKYAVEPEALEVEPPAVSEYESEVYSERQLEAFLRWPAVGRRPAARNPSAADGAHALAAARQPAIERCASALGSVAHGVIQRTNRPVLLAGRDATRPAAATRAAG